jgi:prepilin-type N-terminal cleavage/methylation domain-containing protein
MEMKHMIERMRTEKGGFTLAELLIVVAIVAVLVAIAIPVFTSSLTKAQIATDQANCRSYYAEQVTTYLTDGSSAVKTISTASKTLTLDEGTSITLNDGTITCSVGSTSGVEVVYTCTSDSTSSMTWGGTS